MIWDVLFPPHCLVTGEPVVCASPLPLVSQEALDALAPAPRPVDLMLTLQRHVGPDDLYLSSVRAMYALGGVSIESGLDVSAIVYGIKYGGRTALAHACGKWMAPLLDDLPRRPTFLVPVPIHRARRRERGYNQADVLARGVEDATGVPVLPALCRTVNTTSQTTLQDQQRQLNVRSVFEMAAVRHNTTVEGAVCTLIDDIFTTGATLNACAEVLLAAGAARVDAITFGATV